MSEKAHGPVDQTWKPISSARGASRPDGDLQTAMLDAVCDALTAAFIIYDGTDQIVYSSRQVRHYFPVRSEFLKPGTRLRDFLGAVYDSGGKAISAGDDRTDTLSRDEWIAERIAAHWRERSDVQERDASGRWIRFSKRRLPSGYGICVVTDITEQKKREEQWRADLERVQLTEEILDNLPCPIFVQDRNLVMVAVNKAFCELRGAGSERLLGGSLKSTFDPALAARLDASCRHTLETGSASVAAEKLTRGDGRETTVVIRIQRVGKPGRYFIVTSIEDMADLPVTGLDLPAAAKPAPTTSVAARVSDDGKDAAAPQAPGPSGHDFSGRKVLLVTSQHQREARSLGTLSAMGVDACSVRSAEEQEAFLDVAGSVGVSLDLIVIDTEMDIRCLELAERSGADILALDGFEFATELQARVAGRLGASLHREILGDDWEISTTPESKGEAAGDRPQVLVAEDNEINQIVFSQILEGLGYSYRIATTGEEAVRLWQELRPQIVLMDITLPVLNGLEACRQIRELGRLDRRRTPIVGVLAQAFDNSRDECLAAGMNDVILKPMSPDMIAAVFKRFLPDLAGDSQG